MRGDKPGCPRGGAPLPCAPLAPDYLAAAWEIYQKYKDKKISFTDVSCFSIMKNLNIEKAFSFDRDFAQAGIVLMKPE